jgi:hypothetical protein
VAQQQQVLEDMKKALWQQPGRAKGLWTAAAVMFLGLAGASAQLAITEVMSAAKGLLPRNPLNSDWWELTNFDTNAIIDVTDYYWRDNEDTDDHKVNIGSLGILEIRPGKSVVFFRARETPNVAAFSNWWGGCLGTNLQEIRPWNESFGFNGDWPGDELRLYDAQGQLVDGVDFPKAWQGVTFISKPNTGEFGFYSTLGQSGTCQTATRGDIGSPGTACGPVPLSIQRQPVSVEEAWPGLEARFSVSAWGLPRARYQWLFNSNSIPGATSNPLVIADPQSTDEGVYQVVLSNGLERVLSTNVTLTLRTNPCPPILFQELSDVEVFVGENARFSVLASAVPRPQFQWESDGVDIIDATNRTLVIPNATLELSGTEYCVRIWNTNGSTNACARLVVNPTPTLAITEAMPAPWKDTNCPVMGANWWELTNLGTKALKLKGFRHSDGKKLSGALVVTNNVVIQPGESVIFVDQLTRDEFIRWWSQTNLPPGLQVITYGGYGLDPWNDGISVWSAAAEVDTNWLATVSYASSPNVYPILPPQCPCYIGGCSVVTPNNLCGDPIYGHSLFFVTNTFDCAHGGQGSEENENGAFAAEACGDVGSPGFYVLPRFFGCSRNGSTVTLRWRTVKGRRYQVEWRPEVDAGVWTTNGVHAAQGSTVETTDTLPEGTTRRFYRLRELP